MNQIRPFNQFLNQNSGFILLGVSLVVLILLAIVLVGQPGVKMAAPTSGEQMRELANKLFEWKLYPQSVAQYEQYLTQFGGDEQEQANFNYVIGNIYFERLHDYENALAHFAKVKYFYPESNLVPDVNKKIVACLERLQRTQDAHQMLEETTALDTAGVRKSLPGEIIAKMGDRTITQGDFDFELSQLPPYLQQQFTSPEGKKKFLRQFISTELLYDTAKRAGLDQNKDVIQGTFQAKKQLMAQKYLEQEIAQNVDLKPEDVELFFKANQDKYAEKDKDGKIVKEKSFAEVRQQVAQDYVLEKQTRAYEALIERLTRAQSVQIYDDKIK